MKRMLRVLAFIICIPFIGTMFVKPDKSNWKKEEEETSVLDERFEIRVTEETGSFRYRPEKLTELLMYYMVPEDMVFSSSEDYIEGIGMAHDPEQEYLKALAVVCRSNLTYIWECEGAPAVLDYEKLQFETADFSADYQSAVYDDEKDTKRREIKRAAMDTFGAVITKENKVSAAPFFTTSLSDMMMGEEGDGVGFSLNYAYELAKQGMDFYEILKYFFTDIKVNIYE